MNRRTEYLVQWKGEPANEASWEKETSLWQFEEAIQAYLSHLPPRMSESSGGGGLS